MYALANEADTSYTYGKVTKITGHQLGLCGKKTAGEIPLFHTLKKSSQQLRKQKSTKQTDLGSLKGLNLEELKSFAEKHNFPVAGMKKGALRKHLENVVAIEHRIAAKSTSS